MRGEEPIGDERSRENPRGAERSQDVRRVEELRGEEIEDRSIEENGVNIISLTPKGIAINPEKGFEI